jgi:gentisate 1,2-dioxygenase
MATLSHPKSRFFDELSPTFAATRPAPWPALLIGRLEIEAEIARLVDVRRAPGERRASEVVHPVSRGSVPGVAPGLSVSINVLLPGETIEVPRDNATRIEFCIKGEGVTMLAGRRLTAGKWDTWTIPSMTRRHYRGSGRTPFVWLSYSNAPLLQRLDILYSDEADAPPKGSVPRPESKFVRENAPDFAVGQTGARLRGYEFLVDIEAVANPPLLWPWEDVRQHITMDKDDERRIMMLLYNPATERRNGTTHSFFATLGSVPKGVDNPVPERGHKHSSFACNYHLMGSGSSIVDGERVDWEAGDLLFSAPSWSEHAHGSNQATGGAIFTVQDHPFQIGIESLIWQEKADGPILTLGSEPGFAGYVSPRLSGD